LKEGKMIIKKIKIWLFVSIFISFFLVLTSNPGLAYPTLQLDILDGTYDYQTQTIIAPSESFTLYAFLIPDRWNSLTDDYYISAALVPKLTPPGGDLGTFTFNNYTINVTTDMVYGVPPLENIVSLQGWDPRDLPRHGIYPTYFYEFGFQFDNRNQISRYNTQERAQSGGQIPPTTGNEIMYYMAFSVDTSQLNPNYVVHFDLYNTKLIQRTGDIDVSQFAPFSHDAQSVQVPEPSTLLLLGSGLMGAWLFGRRKFKN